jgi:hypothetical protein
MQGDRAHAARGSPARNIPVDQWPFCRVRFTDWRSIFTAFVQSAVVAKAGTLQPHRANSAQVRLSGSGTHIAY